MHERLEGDRDAQLIDLAGERTDFDRGVEEQRGRGVAVESDADLVEVDGPERLVDADPDGLVIAREEDVELPCCRPKAIVRVQYHAATSTAALGGWVSPAPLPPVPPPPSRPRSDRIVSAHVAAGGLRKRHAQLVDLRTYTGRVEVEAAGEFSMEERIEVDASDAESVGVDQRRIVCTGQAKAKAGGGDTGAEGKVAAARLERIDGHPGVKHCTPCSGCAEEHGEVVSRRW